MKKLALTLALTLAAALEAQAAPNMIARFNDWGVYTYDADGKTVCYALTAPTAARPTDVNHGDNFLLIAPSDDQPRAYEPQASMGYQLKPGSVVSLTLEDKKFRMVTKGKSAWVKNLARQPELVRAMKAGDEMTLKATSARGTNTTYTYSLDGVTAALNRVGKCN